MEVTIHPLTVLILLHHLTNFTTSLKCKPVLITRHIPLCNEPISIRCQFSSSTIKIEQTYRLTMEGIPKTNCPLDLNVNDSHIVCSRVSYTDDMKKACETLAQSHCASSFMFSGADAPENCSHLEDPAVLEVQYWCQEANSVSICNDEAVTFTTSVNISVNDRRLEQQSGGCSCQVFLPKDTDVVLQYMHMQTDACSRSLPDKTYLTLNGLKSHKEPLLLEMPYFINKKHYGCNEFNRTIEVYALPKDEYANQQCGLIQITAVEGGEIKVQCSTQIPKWLTSTPAHQYTSTSAAAVHSISLETYTSSVPEVTEHPHNEELVMGMSVGLGVLVLVLAATTITVVCIKCYRRNSCLGKLLNAPEPTDDFSPYVAVMSPHQMRSPSALRQSARQVSLAMVDFSGNEVVPMPMTSFTSEDIVPDRDALHARLDPNLIQDRATSEPVDYDSLQLHSTFSDNLPVPEMEVIHNAIYTMYSFNDAHQ